jgi:hypothetical protein
MTSSAINADLADIKTADVSVSLLSPYAKNSRKHPEHQLKALVSAIKRFGFTQPLIIDEELTILAGHARYEAAKRLNLDAVPCRILSDLSSDEKAAYVIADNKIADEASWDYDNLIPELERIADLSFDEDFAAIFDPIGFGLLDEDPADQYKPVLDPIQGAGLNVTDSSVQKEKERLESQFEEGQGQALVRLTCPHCDESFVIEKRIVA